MTPELERGGDKICTGLVNICKPRDAVCPSKKNVSKSRVAVLEINCDTYCETERVFVCIESWHLL